MIRLFQSRPARLAPEALVCDFGPCRLRVPRRDDFEQWAALRTASRAFLEPWEPTWPADDLTPAAFRRRIDRFQAEIHDDLAYPFFIVERETDRLIGGLNVANVRRRAAMSASLGYWMGASHAGKGVMSGAVRAMTRHAFRHFRLERIEAACLPENRASIRVLEKAGFRREGFARGYLAIAGVRRDHLLFGLIRSDLAGEGPP